MSTPERFEPLPLDWEEPVPEVEVLFPPYLYAAHRTWVWGPLESGKSIWIQWVSAQLSRQGRRVVYVQQDNSLPVETRRWRRLGFDPDCLAVYHDEGFDLADPAHVDALARLSEGAALVVVDTLGACWSGDENSNQEVNRFNREVLRRLIDQGCAVVVVHHTGHAIGRDAGTAGRGASSEGQGSDTVLDFRIDRRYAQGAFVVHHGKNRPGGGVKEAPRIHRVVDLPDGSLTIVVDAKPLVGRVTRAQQEARRKVRAYLESLPDGAGFMAIVGAAGVSVNMATKVLSDMEADGELESRRQREAYVLRRSGLLSGRDDRRPVRRTLVLAPRARRPQHPASRRIVSGQPPRDGEDDETGATPVTEDWLREAMTDATCTCGGPTRPDRIEETEPGWYVGFYRCAECGDSYRVGWSLDLLRRQMGV